MISDASNTVWNGSVCPPLRTTAATYEKTNAYRGSLARFANFANAYVGLVSLARVFTSVLRS